MRAEAVKAGAFIIHRAVGEDGRMGSGNEDLLEVRWPGILGSRCLLFQDRFRDIKREEMKDLDSWASSLSLLSLSGQAASPFEPMHLAAEDPGIFWSCVTYCCLAGDEGMRAHFYPLIIKGIKGPIYPR